MRRAMRHAQILGSSDPLMYRLVPTLTREMGQAYPELIRAELLIAETLKLEETRFRSALARGLAILEDEMRSLGDGGVLNGETAFRLDLGHLWLPARSDPGRFARPRSVGRYGRVQRRHGAPARRGAPRLVGFGGRGDRNDLVRLTGTRRRDRVSSAMKLKPPRA